MLVFFLTGSIVDVGECIEFVDHDVDIVDPKIDKIESFEYDGKKICNFEMESSAVAGLASLLGHRAMTCCMVIANRYTTEMNTEYKNSIDTLISKVLDRI